MGMVTDVLWKCPGCGKEQIAQLYGDFYPDFEPDFDEEVGQKPLSRKAVPSDAELKWNPPCEKCGEYKLVEPTATLVEFPIERISER